MRISILKVILNEIENIEISDVSSEYQIKQSLHIAVHRATSHYAVITNENHIIYNREKQLFYDYLAGIKEKDLKALLPLPYRKVLMIEQVAKIKETFKNCWLERIWNIGDTNYEDIVSIESDYFFKEVNLFNITNILKRHGIRNIWEIDTCSFTPISYLMDLTLLDIESKSGDIFWCSENMAWGIARDHEGIIYICSTWLINELKNSYPNLLYPID